MQYPEALESISNTMFVLDFKSELVELKVHRSVCLRCDTMV